MHALKLNLGCGLDKRKDWVNIDAFPGVKPDLIHDLLDPLPFKNKSVDYVLAQDILEHFTKEDVEKVIAEIGRVVKVGGKVEVRIPNIDDIIVRFADDKEVRNEFLYGTTEVTGVFGAHKVGYTPEMMTVFMLEQGFNLEVLETEDTNYHFIFVKSDSVPRLKSFLLAHGKHSTEEKNLIKKTTIQLNKSGVNATIIDSPFRSLASTLQFISQMLKKERPQLLVLFGFTEQVIGSWIASLFSLPVVWIEYGKPAKHFNDWFKLRKVLYYSSKEFPITVIVPSKDHKSELTGTAHISLSKIFALGDSKSLQEKMFVKALERTLDKVEAERQVQQFLS